MLTLFLLEMVYLMMEPEVAAAALDEEELVGACKVQSASML
jgi:hypothetical protein